MRYVYVENGEIKSHPRQLPESWGNISNFHAFDPETILSYGWYPHTFIEATPFNNCIISGSYFVIEEKEVIEYQTLREKTQEEIDAEIESKWMSIRIQRNKLLIDCDWTQLPDSPLTIEKKEEWVIYRQQLRDITNYTSPDDVIWPIPPGSILESSNNPPLV